MSVKPDMVHYLLRWVSGFCDVIDGLFLIFTLGFYNPYLGFKLVIYNSKRSIKRMQRRE